MQQNPKATTGSNAVKSVTITGGNAGIGFATAKLFLAKGYKVTIVGRSKERLEVAQKELGEVGIGICDISSLPSIDTFVKNTDPIDILVNNAGISLTEYKKSDMNQELTFQTNHLGTMYLTLRMLENKKLNENGVIIVLSSKLHLKAIKDVNYFDNLAEANFKGLPEYNQTKLFNLLFTRYLVTKYLPLKFPDLHYKVATVHPGYIPTEITRDMTKTTKFFYKYVLRWVGVSTTVEDAAGRILKCVTDPGSNGKYIGNKGYEEPSSFAKDDADALALWNKSMDILKLNKD